MQIVELLDKARLLTKSDAKTAKYLGMPKQHLSNVRNGLRKLTPYQSAKLAELIGEPWHLATLERLAELAPCEEERQFWRGKSATLRGIAARVAMVVFLTIGAGFPCHAGNGRVMSLSIDQTIYCALVRIRRTARRLIRGKAVFRGAGYRLRNVLRMTRAAVAGAMPGRCGLPSFGPY